ncbi:CAP domain-containing protein [Pseudarthrobacter sp. RMG13]|uniref:CAP domain-containing protein n=2 Tax=Pseudarthrobacter humi TaxID=2952523 RepID=A0ABT1LQ83_9MICC|nr:CAP domain-containing protein [Pseudarthrobacter humi]
MLCALALVSPAAGMYSGPAANAPVQAGAFGPRTVTLGPAGTADDDDGAPDLVTGTGSPLAPAVEPVITPASPAGEGTSGTAAAPPTATVAAHGTTTPEPVAPEPPSLPPLWAPESELAHNKTAAPTLSAPTAPAPATESLTTESLGTEALVPDSNTAAILTVFTKINEYRAANSLAPVKYHPTVAGMAQEWSDSIASRDVIEHRASFWTDPRALNPNSGGEVIAIRTDRDAAKLVEWWKGSPGHNAMLLDPRFNVMGAGISYTNSLYTIWGVVNFFGYTTLPAGTVTSPGGSSAGGGAFPPPPPTMCDPAVKHMPPTLNLANAAINSAADLVTINAAGQLINRPSTGNRTFGAAKVIGSGFGTAKEVFTTDWDRDGAYDLLTQWTTGNLTLHRGIATGGFQASVTLGSGGWETLTLAVGGWCANNRLPQLVALEGTTLYLYPNVGLADMSTRTQIASTVSARKLSMVDYDADGFQDLLAIRSDGAVQLYRGAGTPAPRVEARLTVATGWTDVTGIRPLRDVTALNSTGVALRRANDVVQYWNLSTGTLASPSNITGNWAGQRLAQ